MQLPSFAARRRALRACDRCGSALMVLCSTAYGLIANAPGRYESTAAAAPIRSWPISAPSRAMSVDSRSGVGWARANSVCWSTRPGVGSIATVTALDRRGRRMRFEIEQRQRPQRPDVAHRRRQLEPPRMDLAALGGRTEPQHARAARRRRDRGARAASTAARAGESGRTTATRAPRSATRARAWRRSAPRAARGRAAACLLRARSPATPAAPRPSRAARSAGGSAASSPSVLMPQCLTAEIAELAEPLWF